MRFCLQLILGAAVLGTTTPGILAAAGLPLPDAASNPPHAAGSSHAVWVVKVDMRTGKLVRTLVAPPKPAGTDADVRSLVAQAAKSFDVNPLLVDSVIEVESNYNPFAVSPKGAQGLMQLMPKTAANLGVGNSFAPNENVNGGTAYLDALLKKYHDNLALALAAYNAGPAAVDRWHGIPPYHETRVYVARVIREFNRRYAARMAAQKQGSGTQVASASQSAGR